MRAIGDIKGFTASLRKHGTLPTLKDVALRHFLNNFQKSLMVRIPTQENLVSEILDGDSFLLIILDACRFDLFAVTYKWFFVGELIPVRSFGTFLPAWLPKLFSNDRWKGARIFKARLKIPPHNISLQPFIKRTNVELYELCEGRGFLGTPLPDDVNKFTLSKGLKKKTVIWYMQPHYPWSSCPNVSKRALEAIMRYEFELAPRVEVLLSKHGIGRKKIVYAYTSNLLLVLKSLGEVINQYVNQFDGDIIITSDHGELLGEYGLYFHPPGYNLRQLIIVPWFCVKKLKI